ncbi:hypothetical protein [Arthrobacter sp. CJ23]|uniref:hypothetical protein n=1 Tax=Arthrobacter sp. CJ23 TaxID=2972479 RepID=UPI00215BD1B2|nr:hypothetical protein [Arthrobacter sp. CJ23]UVJ39724.1 hypothetical protein NVV90_00535 [Arthrobacter sp. CJ23]
MHPSPYQPSRRTLLRTASAALAAVAVVVASSTQAAARTAPDPGHRTAPDAGGRLPASGHRGIIGVL